MGVPSNIIVFCGKGGVGKTTLSLGLALRRAAEGQKVVVVSSHPLSELAVAVSLSGLPQRFPHVVKNFFVVHLDPKELLADVVRKNFPVQWVAESVLKSKIYQNLIEVAPGLKEFYFLSRLQALAERRAAGEEQSANRAPVTSFDTLIWDAPATGHFLSTLRAARNFKTYLTGPLASAGAEVERFFSNMQNVTVVAATTLEEMPIEETIEMCRALEREFNLRPEALVLNLVSPPTATGAPVDDLVALAGRTGDPALRFAVDRVLLERERAATIRAAVPAPAVCVERIRASADDLDLLDRVGGELAAIGAGAVRQ